MLVALTIEVTTTEVGEPPLSVPVPPVAEIVCPTVKLAVLVMLVIVAVQGPVPVIVPPIVPVVLTTILDDANSASVAVIS